MKQLKVLSALSLLTLAGAAHADVTSTWTATNDYDFRGISQTSENPAIQASLDFATDIGFYVGGWASNVDVIANNELDIYAGFSGKAGAFGYDAGVIYYTYDEAINNFAEAYVSGSIGPFKAKLWYSNEFAGYGWDGDTDSQSAAYLEGNLSIPVGDTYTLLAHVGYSTGDYWDTFAKSIPGGHKDGDGDYVDYALGVGATYGNFTTAIKFVGTSNGIVDNVYTGDTGRRIVLSVATTFPWK